MLKKIKTLWENDDALSPFIEWTLGVAIIALIAAPVMTTLANTVKDKLNTINTEVQNAGT